MSKSIIYIICFTFFLCSCVKRNSTIVSDNYTEQYITHDNSKENYGAKEDSLLKVIQEQFAKDNVIVKNYNRSPNKNKLVRLGIGYAKVPDSIAYQKVFYKNGNICCEGYITYFEDVEMDNADEVGKWKYCTPDGTKFEKYYDFSSGVKNDSLQ